jgi:antitoxin VapB
MRFLESLAMALSIKTEKADRLARELAAVTGETLTLAVETALAERLARERERRSGEALDARVEAAIAWVDEWRKGLIAKGYDLDRRRTRDEETELLGDETDLRLLEEERASRRRSDAA